MKLMTKAQEKKLISQFRANQLRTQATPHDFKPVLKLFGGSSCTWLLSEYDPDNDVFFGLCDLGVGFPEMGYVSLDELIALKFKPFGLPIERDMNFRAKMTIGQYHDIAKELRRIDT